VEIPLRKFVCVTGVSGSGKSSLVDDVLCKRSRIVYGSRMKPAKNKGSSAGVDRQVYHDRPVGDRPYAALQPRHLHRYWTWIRDLYSQTPEARVRGYKPGRFSFTSPGAAKIAKATA